MSGDSSAFLRALEAHTNEHFGPPVATNDLSASVKPEYRAQLPHLEVAVFNETDKQALVITRGLCVPEHTDGRRIEAAIRISEPQGIEQLSHVAKFLAGFAVLASDADREIGSGVQRVGDDVRAFSRMDDILVVPPRPMLDDRDLVDLGDGKYIELVSLIPVYRAEAEFAREHGVMALIAMMGAQGLDLADMNRPPADLSLPSDVGDQD